MKLFISLLGFLAISNLAQATCMQMCDDTDGGDNPGHFGVTVVKTSCAPPGGPIHETTSQYFDTCGNGIHTEYYCSHGMPGATYPIRKFYSCSVCSTDVKGECLVPGPGVEQTDIGNPTYTCSQTIGTGPHIPDLPPQGIANPTASPSPAASPLPQATPVCSPADFPPSHVPSDRPSVGNSF